MSPFKNSKTTYLTSISFKNVFINSHIIGITYKSSFISLLSSKYFIKFSEDVYAINNSYTSILFLKYSYNFSNVLCNLYFGYIFIKSLILSSVRSFLFILNIFTIFPFPLSIYFKILFLINLIKSFINNILL